MAINQKQLAGLKEAAAKLDAFLGASIEPGSTSCSTFGLGPEPMPGWVEFSEEQRRQVRIYLESWVQPALDAVLASVQGESDYEQERLLAVLHDPRKAVIS